MNLYLALTKLKGSLDHSELKPIVMKKGEQGSDGKAEFYYKLKKDYETFYKTNLAEYEQRMEQYKQAVARFPWRCFRMRGQSPLVIEQGESVLETQLTLHRTYGIPYIPGTALKGVVAHFCHRVLGGGEGERAARFREGGEVYTLLFGSPGQQALIGYHDAFPTADTVGTALRVDVMTPHHQLYNQMTLGKTSPEQASAPRDDDSPVPIPFLAVVANFQFTLTCRSDDPADQKWLDIALRIVREVLEQDGIGGKTNAGYGRFQWLDDHRQGGRTYRQEKINRGSRR